MTRNILYILLLLTATACTADDDPVVSPVVQEKTFNMSVDFTKMPSVTRAIRENDDERIFPTTDDKLGDVMGIYALSSKVAGDKVEPVDWKTSQKYRSYNNSPYILVVENEGEEDETSKLLHRDSKAPTVFPGHSQAALVFYSYIPYNSNIGIDSDTKSPKIPVTITADPKDQIDYLYAAGDVIKADDIKGNGDTDFRLHFRHALCRIKLKVAIEGDQRYNANYCPKLYSIKVKTQKRQEAYMEFTSNSIMFNYTGQSGLTEFVCSYDEENPLLLTDKETKTKADFVLIPSDDDNKGTIDQISVTLMDADGSMYNDYVVYDYRVNGALKMQPGYYYTVSLNYRIRANVQQSGQSIEMWIDEDKYNKEITIE